MNMQKMPHDNISFLLESGAMAAGGIIIFLGVFDIWHLIMVDSLIFNLACLGVFLFRLYRYNRVARATPGMRVATIHDTDLGFGYMAAVGGIFWFAFFTIWPGGW